MKKSLIALAIASAVSAPAFAATSNVDVYGVLNMSVNYVDQDVPGTQSSVNVTSTASRIGFKGAEDLGGGLAAIWQIESGFNADEQSGSLATRNTFVGLKGGFGTVLAGNHDTPMKLLGRMVDPFADTLADSRNVLGAVRTGANIFDMRTKNTVAYVSPNWSGFTMAAAYVADWSATTSLDSQNTDAYSINAVYNNGPLMLGAAYETHNGFGSGVGGVGTNSDMWRIVAGFDVAGFKLAGLYEQIGGDVAAYNRDAYGLFATYNMGAWAFKADYMAAQESDAPGGNDGADQWTAGADYSLSKRTVVYGYYARTSNDNVGGYGLGAGAGSSDQTVGNLGSNPSTFSMGVKHAF
jgi:predicted porin